MAALRRKGGREKLAARIKELEDRIKELTEGREQDKEQNK